MTLTRPAAAERALALTTVDGERLRALHLPRSDDDRGLAVVVAHGFTLSTRRPGVRRVLETLSAYAGVIGFDFRGHGGSTGRSTVGDREVLDVEAAVVAARSLGYRDVVTCGWSMGGGVAIRHAALHGGVEAVISVSGLSRWYYRGTAPMRRVHWAIQTRAGRLVAHRVMRTRILPDGWDPDQPPKAPYELIGQIAPIPLLVVHGDRDHYFPLEHPEQLFAAAREPKELWIEPGFGHAESAASPELLARLGAHLPVLVSRGPGRTPVHP